MAHTPGRKARSRRRRDRFQGLCSGARLVGTQGHGHMKVLVAPETLQAVGAFPRGG